MTPGDEGASESDDGASVSSGGDGGGEDDEGEFAVDRRTLLAAGLAGSGLGLAAYLLADDGPENQSAVPQATPTPTEPPAVDDEEEEEAPTVPEDHVPFSIWAEQRAAIRSSPDHLGARASRLVDEGDPEAIFAFVRDDVATVPTNVGGTGATPDDDVDAMRRWGARGALRSGTGTPRDKADLLADLLSEAGYDAEVKSYRFDQDGMGLDEDGVRDHYLRSLEREYAPDVDEETVADWEERAEEIDPTTVLDSPDDDGRATDLADDLSGALPESPAEEDGGPEAFDWRWDVDYRRSGDTPLVAFEDDGETRYANLFGDVPFGERGPGTDLTDPRDPAVDTVSVTLSAVTAGEVTATDAADRDSLELVAGEWPVPDLVGRQLLVRMQPVKDTFEYPTTPFRDMTTYVPTLGLQAPDAPAEEMGELSEFGDAVTISGDRLSVDHSIEDGELVVEDETPTRNGRSLYEFHDDADPDAVDSLAVEADAGLYPRIRLDVEAVDADGTPVSGLSPTAFAASDEGQRVTPHLLDNVASPNPLVLFVRDTSSSMRDGVDGATENATYDDLRAFVRETDSSVTIETEQVESDMWARLTGAIERRPDLIVYAHDGDPEDAFDESMIPTLETAPPTVFLSATDEARPVEEPVVLEQAELTDGRVAPLGDADAVHETLEAALDDVATPSYRFEYRAPDDGRGARTVELGVGSEPEASPAATATAQYEPEDAPPTDIVGLHLTVSVGDRSVTRTLAGWDPVADGPPEDDDGFDRSRLEEWTRDVRNAAYGTATLSFEGDGVPLAVALDDFLGALTSRQDLAEAGIEGNYEEQLEAWQAGYTEIPWELFALQSPLPDAVSEDGLTYFDGPRIVLSQLLPTVHSETLAVHRSLDVLPLSRAATAVDGPDERFWTTLERTADVAVTESDRGDTSTLSLLDGADLTRLDDLTADDVGAQRLAEYETLREIAGVSPEDYQLVPADGSELAFWNVDRQTGSVLGIIDDGTGGAREVRLTGIETDAHWDTANDVASDVIEILEQRGAISGLGATSLGVIADYYAELAKMYGQVTVLLASAAEGARENRLENDLDEDLEQMIQDLAKNAAEELFDHYRPDP